MTARHTVIDSPLGGLTLVADEGVLTGVYFRHHWHPPTAEALGEYVELAAELSTTAYEVGQIVGRNPLSIVIPCHRVVGKDGALTGYAGGLKRKRFLLDLEEPAPAVAGKLF
ncbi:methylated-DNA--[protein]-cysteine S-methyltransferase [Mycobacterium stomatepiae]|nr:methylated-DNA--[protein]-cysteine S-methyltransferase [Mycobacterium stomatepiae]MCV7166646.1 methylated-DNA--[protein]-cysteine S-methyltransferase [Mycobacterium stomatepiae]